MMTRMPGESAGASDRPDSHGQRTDPPGPDRAGADARAPDDGHPRTVKPGAPNGDNHVLDDETLATEEVIDGGSALAFGESWLRK